MRYSPLHSLLEKSQHQSSWGATSDEESRHLLIKVVHSTCRRRVLLETFTLLSLGAVGSGPQARRSFSITLFKRSTRSVAVEFCRKFATLRKSLG
jgi:hypothetical protein